MHASTLVRLLVCGLFTAAGLAAPPVVAEGSSDVTSSSLLAEARTLYEGLEYDQVIPIAEAILARDDTPIDQRLDAYLLQGSAMAIVGDPIEAEKPYRLLLRARPDFDLPGDTPPKILAVFRKVQAEENIIRDVATKALRKSLVESLAILGEDPTEREGGLPVRFRYRVRDANSSVEGVRILYKKQQDAAYSSLALKRSEEGEWRASIPGEWTANDDGFTLHFYLETFDNTGILVTRGSKAAPLNAAISPGTADRAPPPPLPLWSFFVVSGGAATAAIVGGVFTGLTLAAQAEYTTMLDDSVGGPAVAGARVETERETGQTLMWTQFGFYGAAAGIALGAAVMAPFINWTGEELAPNADAE